MGIDEGLLARIRPLLERHEPVDEKRMFGGLAFLVHGHMTVCVTSHRSLMVRVREEDRDALLALDGAGEMVMRGSATKTWVLVSGPVLDDDDALAEWVERGVETIEDLPPKA